MRSAVDSGRIPSAGIPLGCSRRDAFRAGCKGISLPSSNHDGDVLDLLAGFGVDARFHDVVAVVEDFHDLLPFFLGANVTFVCPGVIP